MARRCMCRCRAAGRSPCKWCRPFSMIRREHGSMVERPARLPALPASVIGADGVTLSPAPDGARFVFRGPEGAAQAAGEAWGTPLSRVACRATMAMGRAALWLGPDEWLLLAPGEEPETVAAQLAARLP